MEEKLGQKGKFERTRGKVTKTAVRGLESSEHGMVDDNAKTPEKIDEHKLMQQLLDYGKQGLAEGGNLR